MSVASRVSKKGKNAQLDQVLIERFWRSWRYISSNVKIILNQALLYIELANVWG